MKEKREIIIIGTGGHAKLLVDIVEESGNYKIVGFTSKESEEGTFCGYPLLGDDSVLVDHLKKGVEYVALGVGAFKNNRLRKEIFERTKDLGFKVATLIHPSSTISRSAIIKEGAVIFSGVIINNHVEIGQNTIVATGSTIDHESVVASHVLVSAGVTIGAYTKIEEGVLCALGSKIVSGVQIGKDILIGAGAVVVRDISAKGTYVGIPAKIRA